jgi:ferritin-like protein
MGTKLLLCGPGERRRGASRAVVCVAALTAALFAGGCGDSSDESVEREKAADAEILNSLLGRELTLVRAYGPSTRLSHGPLLALLLRFRGQDQAHLVALTKAMKGVGGEVEAEPEDPETLGPGDRAEALTLAYEEENAALDAALDAAPHLQTFGPRALAAALAASHAQHLVVLRQVLGSTRAASVPQSFESGEEPPPGEER